MRVLFLVFIVFVPARLWCQDFSGRWTGYLKDSINGTEEKLSLNIGSHDSLLTGVMHYYSFPEQHYHDFTVNGQFHLENSGIILFKNLPRESGHAPLLSNQSCFLLLRYKQESGKEILEGHWYDPDKPEIPGKISVLLKRETGKFIPLPFPSWAGHHRQPDSLKALQRNDPMLGRNSIVAAVIPVKADSVKVSLYDNGTIDGDSISLYMNNTLLLQHLRLAENAKVLYVHINRQLPVNKLVLVAENLGTMPPNTALMEVTTEQNTYNVYLSSDFSKNAMVEFIMSSQ